MTKQAEIAEITDTESTLIQDDSGWGPMPQSSPRCLLHETTFKLWRLFAGKSSIRFSRIYKSPFRTHLYLYTVFLLTDAPRVYFFVLPKRARQLEGCALTKRGALVFSELRKMRVNWRVRVY